MERLFLAYGFTDANRALVSDLEKVCSAFDVRLVTGAGLGGQPLSAAVQSRIKGCDAIIALATRERRDDDGISWHTHQWVHDELSTANERGLQSIALVERHVLWRGMKGERERIEYEGERWSNALLRVAETVGLWKREAGRRVKVRLDLSQVNLGSVHTTTARYRLRHRDEAAEWSTAELVQEPGGIVFYARGVTSDEQTLEVEVEAGTPRRFFRSPATPQVLSVQLMER